MVKRHRPSDDVIINKSAIFFWMEKRKIRSLAELSRRTGLGYTNMLQILNGNKRWYSSTLARIACVLKIHPRKLVIWEGEKESAYYK